MTPENKTRAALWFLDNKHVVAGELAWWEYERGIKPVISGKPSTDCNEPIGWLAATPDAWAGAHWRWFLKGDDEHAIDPNPEFPDTAT